MIPAACEIAGSDDTLKTFAVGWWARPKPVIGCLVPVMRSSIRSCASAFLRTCFSPHSLAVFSSKMPYGLVAVWGHRLNQSVASWAISLRLPPVLTCSGQISWIMNWFCGAKKNFCECFTKWSRNCFAWHWWRSCSAFNQRPKKATSRRVSPPASWYAAQQTTAA